LWEIGDNSPTPSLRANGSRECAPDDRLCEAIQRILFVMAGLDPAIHVLVSRRKNQDMDHRDKHGDDS
jgi:hypothetical protein